MDCVMAAWSLVTQWCYNENHFDDNKLTADLSGTVQAVVHGAGVGPLLSVGFSLFVPALCREEETENTTMANRETGHVSIHCA